jgi:hypothetical protein
MKTQDVVSEKLIKVPIIAYQELETPLLDFTFTWLTKVFPRRALFRETIKNYMLGNGINFMKNVSLKRGRAFRVSIDDTRVDWPKNYPPPRDDYEFDNITMIINLGGQEHTAMEYDSEYGAVYVYLINYTHEFQALERDESEDTIFQELQTIRMKLQADLEHELMHFMQHVSIGTIDAPRDLVAARNIYKLNSKTGKPMKEPKHLVHKKGTMIYGKGDPVATGQEKSLKGYHRHGKNYYLSPNEFDPTIRSEVGDFMAGYAVQGDFKKQILQHFRASEFFRTLKKYDRPRYHIAIKKFLIDLDNRYIHAPSSE